MRSVIDSCYNYKQAAGLAAESSHLKERRDVQMRVGRREAVCYQVLLACEPTEDR